MTRNAEQYYHSQLDVMRRDTEQNHPVNLELQLATWNKIVTVNVKISLADP